MRHKDTHHWLRLFGRYSGTQPIVVLISSPCLRSGREVSYQQFWKQLIVRKRIALCLITRPALLSLWICLSAGGVAVVVGSTQTLQIGIPLGWFSCLCCRFDVGLQPSERAIGHVSLRWSDVMMELAGWWLRTTLFFLHLRNWAVGKIEDWRGGLAGKCLLSPCIGIAVWLKVMFKRLQLDQRGICITKRCFSGGGNLQQQNNSLKTGIRLGVAALCCTQALKFFQHKHAGWENKTGTDTMLASWHLCTQS